MLNTIKSVVFGHAIGDALGVPVEFNGRTYLKKNPVTDMMGYGTYNVPAGSWSDDTSMALCALDVLSKGDVDYNAIMRNFCDWYTEAAFTPTDVLFDIGNTCCDAILNYLDTGCEATKCGRRDERSNGNGSLMRIYPFVLYAYYNNIKDEMAFVDIIARASSLTHGHTRSINGCIIYAYVLRELLDNPEKASVYKGIQKAKSVINNDICYDRIINNNIAAVDGADIKGSGYVVDSLEASLWCLLNTDNYKDCVLKAVNLGDDTDTTAAIAGSLAGALYGIENIPTNWLTVLKKKNFIEDMCERAHKNWR